MAMQLISRLAVVLFTFESAWNSAIAAIAECAEQEDLVVLLQTASVSQRLTQASTPKQVARASTVAGEGKSEIAYIGATGCDHDDDACVAGPSGLEDVIFAVEVYVNGTLVPRPELATNVGGMPQWLTVAKQPSQSCLFASINPSRILGLSIGTNWALDLSTAGENPGGLPIQSAVMPIGSVLVSANYADVPSVTSLQIGAGCHVHVADVIQNSEWSESDHIHGVVTVGRLAYICAFSMDMVYVYSLSPTTGTMRQVGNVSTPPGCSPRHAVQHPGAPFLYVICESSGELLAFSQADDGLSLMLVQISTVSPSGCPVGCKAAELAILPDGSTLYASNRGAQNTVTAYTIGAEDGHLQHLQQVAAPSFPRGMTLAMGGQLLLVAGQTKTELVSFSVEPDGKLKRTGHSLTQGLPPQPGTIAIF